MRDGGADGGDGGEADGESARAEPLLPGEPAVQRLRVEADGAVLADVQTPVAEVGVRAGRDDGLAEVTVQLAGAPAPVRAVARTVTVSGAGFRYRADASRVTGPVPARTWTAVPAAWRLVLPPGSAPAPVLRPSPPTAGGDG
ncbi:hypothetical protein HLB32_31515 [Streptomyces cacaoi]|nr:hypothetical protein [Streptomyces cacaoi]